MKKKFYYCECKWKRLSNVVVGVLCVMYFMYLSAFGYCSEIHLDFRLLQN